MVFSLFGGGGEEGWSFRVFATRFGDSEADMLKRINIYF